MNITIQQQRNILWACEQVWLFIGMSVKDESVTPKAMVELTAGNNRLSQYKFNDEYDLYLQMVDELGTDQAATQISELSIFDAYEGGGAYSR